MAWTPPNLSPEELAELDNAEQAASELARDGRTDRRCLKCGGTLVYEHLGSGYRVLCKEEKRVIFNVRGI